MGPQPNKGNEMSKPAGRYIHEIASVKVCLSETEKGYEVEARGPMGTLWTLGFSTHEEAHAEYLRIVQHINQGRIGK